MLYRHTHTRTDTHAYTRTRAHTCARVRAHRRTQSKSSPGSQVTTEGLEEKLAGAAADAYVTKKEKIRNA